MLERFRAPYYFGKGCTRRDSGNISESIYFFEKAYFLSKKSTQEELIAVMSDAFADILFKSGEYERAKCIAQESLEIYQRLDSDSPEDDPIKEGLMRVQWILEQINNR